MKNIDGSKRRRRDNHDGPPPPYGLFLLDEFGHQSPLQVFGSEQNQSEDAAERFAFNCFLCNRRMVGAQNDPLEDTGEHVIPQWMIRCFGIENTRRTYGDPSSSRYVDIKIPACRDCNNVQLNRVEDRLARAWKRGYNGLSSFPRADLLLWCTKVYYGLVHLDSAPRNPHTKQREIPTLPESLLQSLQLLRLLLQGFRKRVIISGPNRLPCSLLLFPLQCGPDLGNFFQIQYVIPIPGISMQLGRIGILAVLDDYGQTEDRYADVFAQTLTNQVLHPDQFWELTGRLFYRSFINPCATSYTAILGAEEMTLMLTPRSLSSVKSDRADEAQWASVLSGGVPCMATIRIPVSDN